MPATVTISLLELDALRNTIQDLHKKISELETALTAAEVSDPGDRIDKLVEVLAPQVVHLFSGATLGLVLVQKPRPHHPACWG